MSVRASRTGLMPTVTKGTHGVGEKKVSSATLARRARSNSPIGVPVQVPRGVSKVHVGSKTRTGSVQAKVRPVNSMLHHKTVVEPTPQPPMQQQQQQHQHQHQHQHPVDPVLSKPDDDTAQQEIERLTSNTSEVQDLINMYKDLLKDGGSSDNVMSATSMFMGEVPSFTMEEETVVRQQHVDVDDLAEQVTVLEGRVEPKTKKPNVVYTEYHKQIEKVEGELHEAKRDRAVLVEQNAGLESRCLGLERDLDSLRKQHVELHVNTQTTNEKLISYIQGLMKSINELSDRVRTLEGGGAATAAQQPASPEPTVEQQQPQQQQQRKSLTVNTPSSLLALHPATTPITTTTAEYSSPDESVGTLSSSPSPSFSLRSEIRRQLGVGYPNPSIPTPTQSADRMAQVA